MSNYVPPWCKHGSPDDHTCDAKFVLIGEAPGKREDERLQPFVGPAGAIWESWLYRTGPLRRADFAIFNVYPFRPPGNVIAAIPQKDIEEWGLKLKEHIAKLADPWLIVPTGNTALRCLFGGYPKIMDWRGSVLEYKDLQGRSIKCIPTPHPAATFRQPILSKFCLADWQRITQDSAFKELRLPSYKHVIDPTPEEIAGLLMRCQKLNGAFEKHPSGIEVPWALAIDIENKPTTGEITCVGFCLEPGTSLTIPTSRHAVSDDQRAFNWSMIKQLCSTGVKKVGQNFLTDQYKLRFNDPRIVVNNYVYDLMEMDHCLDPNDGGDIQKGSEFEPDALEGARMETRSLSVLASLYTRQPYWKHMAESDRFSWEEYMRYNGIDCCVTREIYSELYTRLVQGGLM